MGYVSMAASHLRLILVLFSSNILLCHGFHRMTIRYNSPSSVVKEIIELKSVITISEAINDEIPVIAILLSQVMFGDDSIPNGQLRELARLEQDDISARYGKLVGPRKYKAALLAAKTDNNIIGCVGIDSQVMSELIIVYQCKS